MQASAQKMSLPLGRERSFVSCLFAALHRFFNPAKCKLKKPSAWCPEKREYAARLSVLLVLLKAVSNLSNLVDFYTVLDRHNDIFSSSRTTVAWDAIATLYVTWEHRVVPSL